MISNNKLIINISELFINISNLNNIEIPYVILPFLVDSIPENAIDIIDVRTKKSFRIKQMYNAILDKYPLYLTKKYDDGSMECYKKEGSFFIVKFRQNVVSDIFVYNNGNCSYFYNNHCFPFSFHILEAILLEWLKKKMGLLLHSAAVAYDDNGLVFLGKSESGKSTTCKLWQDASINAHILGDERIIILPINGEYYIYPTPWKSTFRASHPNKCKRIKCSVINVINHGQNIIENLDKATMISCVFSQAFHHPADNMNTLANINSLLSVTPYRRFSFIPDLSAVACQVHFLNSINLVSDNNLELSKKLFYIQMIIDTINTQGTVSLKVKGDCMAPMIKNEDTVIIKKISIDEFVEGEIFAYHRNGQVYAHRLIKIINTNRGKWYYFKGDNNLTGDPLTRTSNLLGKVISGNFN